MSAKRAAKRRRSDGAQSLVAEAAARGTREILSDEEPGAERTTLHSSGVYTASSVSSSASDVTSGFRVAPNTAESIATHAGTTASNGGARTHAATSRGAGETSRSVSRSRRIWKRNRGAFAALLQRAARDASAVVKDVMPALMNSLQKLSKDVDEQHLRTSAIEICSADVASVRSAVLRLMSRLREQIVAMVDVLTLLRLWLATQRPSHDIGSSGIRDEVIRDLMRMTSIGRASGVKVANGLAKYCWRRGELRRWAMKKGTSLHNADIVRALLSHDTQQLALIRQNCADLKASYSTLLDKLAKHEHDLLAADNDDWKAQFM